MGRELPDRRPDDLDRWRCAEIVPLLYSVRMPTLWLILGLVVALLWSEARSWRPGVWLAKPLASAAVVGYAVQLGAAQSAYGRWVLGGLIACWSGDVLLIPRHRGAFKAGVVCFLIGHLLYSAGFLVHGVDTRWTVVAAIPLAGLAWLVARLLQGKVSPGLRTSVSAYIVVISGMLALGVGAWARADEAVFLLAPAAFYLSDLAVARNRFLHPAFVNRLVGLPLYYAAQVLFAWSVSPG